VSQTFGYESFDFRAILQLEVWRW